VIQRPEVKGAPEAKGPYSPVVQVGDLLFVSGQGPIDPATNEFVLEDIEQQTRLTIENMRRILESCGSGLEHVAKCSVFLTDPGDFPAMNRVYAEFFGTKKPARTTVATALVAPGMKIEIDCIAWCPTRQCDPL
jgi:2-iminobutanoate/2-iminopropanoate deaminase